MGRTQPIDTQRRAEALAIGEQHGAAEASRRTGIPQATIRSWKHRAEQPASPEVDDVDRLERLAQEARRTAEHALAKANEAIAAGRGTDARDLMVAHGIAVEKHGLLARQAQAAREHEARITEQQGEIIAARHTVSTVNSACSRSSPIACQSASCASPTSSTQSSRTSPISAAACGPRMRGHGHDRRGARSQPGQLVYGGRCR